MAWTVRQQCSINSSRNLAREPQHIRELAAISLGDLRDNRSERRYALVIIPFRPLQHMYTVEDQLAALPTHPKTDAEG
jgi:hypothetical protein